MADLLDEVTRADLLSRRFQGKPLLGYPPFGAAWMMLVPPYGAIVHVDPNVISSLAIRLHWHDHVAAVRERLLEGRRAACRRWWNR